MSEINKKENQKLIINKGHYEFITDELSVKLEPKTFLIKNYFTLTATVEELNICNLLKERSTDLQDHYGYTSVGVIEAVGNSCSLNKGDVVLSSAVYSKYHILTEHASINASKVLYRSSYEDYDKVDLLFLPFICIALYLLDIIESGVKERILFRGDSVVFRILACLLIEQNIDFVVFSQNPHKDAYPGFLYNDVKIVKEEEIFFDEMKGTTAVGFILSSDNLPGLKTIEESFGGYILFTNENINFDKPPWMIPHLQNEATRILLDRRFNFEELIAHHVHAEYINQTISYLERGFYYGKMLVYDW